MKINLNKFYFLPICLDLILAGCEEPSGSDLADNVPEQVPEQRSGLDPLLSEQWYLSNPGGGSTLSDEVVDVTGAHIHLWDEASGQWARGATGAGVTIAVVDTALELRHEDLVANVLTNQSFDFGCLFRDTYCRDPSPYIGQFSVLSGDHGTAVAGLAAARGDNAVGIRGVAPNASLQGFNALFNGDLDDDLLSQALGYPGEHGVPSHLTDVFNLSFGSNPSYPINAFTNTQFQQLKMVYEYGTKTLREGKGAIYVKSAGNEFDDFGTCQHKAEKVWADDTLTCYNANVEVVNNLPQIMVVGAFHGGLVRSSYSNTGSSLWLVAPGGENEMVTTDQTGCERGFANRHTPRVSSLAFDLGEDSRNAQCNYYSKFVGTSAATPIVSGVVALLLQTNPALTWRDVKYILAASADGIDNGTQTGLNDTVLHREAVVQAVSNGNLVLEPGWITNGAGFHFHNWYGFGQLNALSAIDMAKNFTSLPAENKQTFNAIETSDQTIWNNSTTAAQMHFNVDNTGTVEHVQLHVTADHPQINQLLIQLQSPTGTSSTLLTPYTAITSYTDPAMQNFLLSSNAFYGESIPGTWTLSVYDVSSERQDGTAVANGVAEGLLQRATITLRYYEDAGIKPK